MNVPLHLVAAVTDAAGRHLAALVAGEGAPSIKMHPDDVARVLQDVARDTCEEHLRTFKVIESIGREVIIESLEAGVDLDEVTGAIVKERIVLAGDIGVVVKRIVDQEVSVQLASIDIGAVVHDAVDRVHARVEAQLSDIDVSSITRGVLRTLVSTEDVTKRIMEQHHQMEAEMYATYKDSIIDRAGAHLAKAVVEQG